MGIGQGRCFVRAARWHLTLPLTTMISTYQRVRPICSIMLNHPSRSQIAHLGPGSPYLDRTAQEHPLAEDGAGQWSMHSMSTSILLVLAQVPGESTVVGLADSLVGMAAADGAAGGQPGAAGGLRRARLHRRVHHRARQCGGECQHDAGLPAERRAQRAGEMQRRQPAGLLWPWRLATPA